MSDVATSKDLELEQRVPLQPLNSAPSALSLFGHRTLIIIVSILALTALGIWWIIRERQNMRNHSGTEYLILESSVTIEIGDSGIEIDYDDDGSEGRDSFETLLDSETPRRLAFEMEKLPTFRVSCKPGNISERRGRRTLKLQPSASGDADMALIDIQDGLLTVSPFSSKKEPKLFGEFLPIRRRTPKMVGIHGELLSGINTAPHSLQSTWRPLDTGELPSEKL